MACGNRVFQKLWRSSLEEKKLELRLGPPGVEDWTKTSKAKGKGKDHESLLSLSHLPSSWMNDNGGNLCKSKSNDGSPSLPQQIGVETLLKGLRYVKNNSGMPLEFCSGEGLVPEGFEMCVCLMLPEEISLITCLPDYAYDKFPRPDNVPEGAHVQWEIELLGFEMQKDWTGMNFRAIMEDVEKTKGTAHIS